MCIDSLFASSLALLQLVSLAKNLDHFVSLILWLRRCDVLVRGCISLEDIVQSDLHCDELIGFLEW